MINCATFLRALAVMIITNSHMDKVYPMSSIATGGLLGNLLFFAISGFVLININKDNSGLKWYKNRILRIYPAIWVATSVQIIVKFFELDSFYNYYIYPIKYPFIGYIILLYIPYYILRKYVKYNDIIKVMISLLILQIIIYLFNYDRTYYHIDNVNKPMIMFLYFQVMLLGLWFRGNINNYLNKNNIFNCIYLFISLIIYFISKILFSKFGRLSNYQIINQIVIFIVIYYFFRCFLGIDFKLKKWFNKIWKIIEFISSLSLEIYIVQFIIIDKLKRFNFPINLLLIVPTIIFMAFILKLLVERMKRLFLLIGKRRKNESFNI